MEMILFGNGGNDVFLGGNGDTSSTNSVHGGEGDDLISWV